MFSAFRGVHCSPTSVGGDVCLTSRGLLYNQQRKHQQNWHNAQQCCVLYVVCVVTAHNTQQEGWLPSSHPVTCCPQSPREILPCPQLFAPWIAMVPLMAQCAMSWALSVSSRCVYDEQGAWVPVVWVRRAVSLYTAVETQQQISREILFWRCNGQT